jgi:hypothetical protein
MKLKYRRAKKAQMIDTIIVMQKMNCNFASVGRGSKITFVKSGRKMVYTLKTMSDMDR